MNRLLAVILLLASTVIASDLPRGSVIVGQKEFNNPVTTTASVDVFTLSRDGNYRLSVSVDGEVFPPEFICNPGPAPSVSAQVKINGGSSGGGYSSLGQSFISTFKAKAGAKITADFFASTDVSGCSGVPANFTPVYSVTFTLEKL